MKELKRGEGGLPSGSSPGTGDKLRFRPDAGASRIQGLCSLGIVQRGKLFCSVAVNDPVLFDHGMERQKKCRQKIRGCLGSRDPPPPIPKKNGTVFIKGKSKQITFVLTSENHLPRLR